jgi:tetratricopeptide (TPR) repeat protein
LNLTEFTSLLNNPNAIGDRHTFVLEKIVDEFPFFQSARAMRLKNLYNQNSFKYNSELKTTAAHTTDRSVLFEFITSENFTAVQKAFFEEKEARIKEILVEGFEIVREEKIKAEAKANTLEQSIISSIKEATSDIEKEEISINLEVASEVKENTSEEKLEEKLEIGKPLDFSSEERHSFQEWLQLSSFKPIDRQDTVSIEEKTKEITEIDLEKKKKLDIIDKFIESNPKISPVKNMPAISIVSERNSQDSSYLMTETLAKVYLEQKKYQKAIQAYEILILKYPEKNHFFADRILDIKLLQQNNNN